MKRWKFGAVPSIHIVRRKPITWTVSTAHLVTLNLAPEAEVAFLVDTYEA